MKRPRSAESRAGSAGRGHMVVTARWLLCWQLLVATLPASCDSADSATPLVEILNPRNGEVYNSSSIGLFVKVRDFELSAEANHHICVQVLWDKGSKSFCRGQVEDWRLNGFEDGNYLVTTQLRDGGHATAGVVAEAQVRFDVALPQASLRPRVFISFPPGDSRVLTSPVVELSFYTTNFREHEGQVCWQVTPDGLYHPTHDACVPAQQHVVGVALPSGRYKAVARLATAEGRLLEHADAVEYVEFAVALDGTADEDVPLPLVQASTLSPSDFQRRMHVVVMSARVLDRYEEALVMIKSLLFHWCRAQEMAGPPLALHLIVDEGGRRYFTEQLLRHWRVPVEVLSFHFHDFQTVCVEPLADFLREFRFPLSPHYSGAAGYCRLFMAPHFEALGLPAFMAVESDQLFFDDVHKLWQLLVDIPAPAFLAAPEMYQPWQDGRPHEGTPDADDQNQLTIAQLDDEYHGNGLIGGLMLFNLTRMKELGWEQRWRRDLLTFVDEQQQKQPGGAATTAGWAPKLNDQDVFNAVLSRHPDWLALLPCEWNLQYHAFMNGVRLCGHDLNCPAALEKGIFVCPRHPSVVHFMSQSYLGGGTSFYRLFWDSVAQMSLPLLQAPLLTVLRRNEQPQGSVTVEVNWP